MNYRSGSTSLLFADALQLLTIEGSTALECAEHGFRAPTIRDEPVRSDEPVRPVSVLAIHFGHDSNMAISIDGRVQCVLEFERLFGKRYFNLMGTSDALQGTVIAGWVTKRNPELPQLPLEKCFRVGVFTQVSELSRCLTSTCWLPIIVLT